MNARTFSMVMQNCHTADNVQHAQDAYMEYQQSHCLHPKLLEITDAHTQCKRTIEVACGSCYHCQESHINEWVTRMYAHCEDFKHVYFVTLTYRSFSALNEVNELLLSKLSQAVWHWDNRNETHRYGYNPCLLQKDHYQKFLKRLRKNTGVSDLTYVLSGEYGKRFGRPHFHAILFTNSELTRDDIVKAWSVALWRNRNGTWCERKAQKRNGQAYNFPIGRVDFHDLVSNGTFNTTKKIRIDGQYLSAHNCFAYVAKYVCKGNDANISRVRIAYNNMFEKKHIEKSFNYWSSWAKACAWCDEHHIKYESSDIGFFIKYDRVLPKQSKTIYEKYLKRTTTQDINGALFVRQNFANDYHEFIHQFEPFVEFSRGTPIGSLYAKTHIQEFAQGVYNRPLLQEQSFVVPDYFRHKAQTYLYGLRAMRKSLSGTSFVYDGLTDLHRHFTDVLSGNCPFKYRHFAHAANTDVKTLCRDQRYSLKDVYTSERILFPVYGDTTYAYHYKYDRHTREYVLTKIVTLDHWLRTWLVRLEEEFVRFEQTSIESRNNLRLTERAFLLATDLGLERTDLQEAYKQKQDQYLKVKQAEYNSTHASAE